MSVSRRKGTAFETLVVDYLRSCGHDVERRALAGKNDKGDIAGLPGWTLECKAEKQIGLAAYVDEARVEAANAGTRRFAAIVKRRQKGVSEAYVIMPLSQFAEMIVSS